MFDFEDLDGALDATNSVDPFMSTAIVLQDRSSARWSDRKSSRWCIEEFVLRQSDIDVTKAFVFLGSSVFISPLLGQAAGVQQGKGDEYAAVSADATRTTKALEAKECWPDVSCLQAKFGREDPLWILKEVQRTDTASEERLRELSAQELQAEIVALQDWREKAGSRLRTLECRAACAVLGLPVGCKSAADINRAFKRRALELHPDKGGDPERFQFLQQMRDVLVSRNVTEVVATSAESTHETGDSADRPSSDTRKEDDRDVAEDDGMHFDDEDDFDVDEEFAQMFTKGREKTRCREAREAGMLGDLGDQSTREGQLEARRKLRTLLLERWQRVGEMAKEIRRNKEVDVLENGGSELLAQMRRFVSTFREAEVTKLRSGDDAQALGVLELFLKQGTEIICLAGAANPTATVESISLQITGPLLCAAPSVELRRRCTAILKSIVELPTALQDVAAIIAAADAEITTATADGANDAASDGKAPLEEVPPSSQVHAPTAEVSPMQLKLIAQDFPTPAGTCDALEAGMNTPVVEASHEVPAVEGKAVEDDDDWFDDFFTSTRPKTSTASVPPPGDSGVGSAAVVQVCRGSLASGIAAVDERPPVSTLVGATTTSAMGRTSAGTWDARWSHPCAGERRADGTSIFCYPCDDWIALGGAYNHRDFELHCEKLGHYGWID
eukprot:TRINITY_DN4582_c0_g2_i1.p1 TRINITY_DN4582_c0_g2~~TRINITY_DN4582_c0_g2_i1.p1  ORF type:complete len:673 (+),score=125.20 TRINITY_DN4582_c0_g2_i1:190-2208(+)